jgi:hypothetical protein
MMLDVKPRHVDLSLDFNDNGTGHGDLALCFARGRWLCDSYYLGIDQGLSPSVGNREKVQAVLRRLGSVATLTSHDLKAAALMVLARRANDA